MTKLSKHERVESHKNDTILHAEVPVDPSKPADEFNRGFRAVRVPQGQLKETMAAITKRHGVAAFSFLDGVAR